MCKCISYNQPEKYQIIKTKILFYKYLNKTVCIDACIADCIKQLWEAGIKTTGSCCGHNKNKPSVIVKTNTEKKVAFTLLKEIDDRQWDVFINNKIA
jgi:hypothetical protein